MYWIAWVACIALAALSVRVVVRAGAAGRAEGASPWRRALARLAADRFALAAIFVLAALALMAILAPALTPYDPTAQLDLVNLKTSAPSAAHPLGTDFASRDVLSRLLFGARITLAVAVLAVLLSSLLGTAYGAIAGFYGGRLDGIMMRALDTAMSVPRILVLIAVVAMVHQVSLVTLIVLIGVTGWFSTSRLVRAQVLALREHDLTTAARALGATDRRILWRHLLPNALSTVLVASTLSLGSVIYLEAALGYLGIGVQMPTPSWGNMIQDGASQIGEGWWLVLLPGLAIIMATIAVNTLGDSLRDAFDPRGTEGA